MLGVIHLTHFGALQFAHLIVLKVVGYDFCGIFLNLSFFLHLHFDFFPNDLLFLGLFF